MLVSPKVQLVWLPFGMHAQVSMCHYCFVFPSLAQAVTGYRLEVAGAGALTNIRDAFVAAAGCTLLSADYSQASVKKTRGDRSVHCNFGF